MQPMCFCLEETSLQLIILGRRGLTFSTKGPVWACSDEYRLCLVCHRVWGAKVVDLSGRSTGLGRT